MIDHTELKDASPWVPMDKPIDIKHLGKLTEELSELISAISRCLIQGLNAIHPETGKPNHIWLREEIADVYANLSLVEDHFNLPMMYERVERKMEHLRRWHQMLDRQPDEKPNDL